MNKLARFPLPLFLTILPFYEAIILASFGVLTLILVAVALLASFDVKD